MNKLLLSTISLVALTATPYYDAYGTTLPAPAPHPSPVPVPVPSPTTTVTNIIQVNDAYNTVLAEGIADGTIPADFTDTVTATFDSKNTGIENGAEYTTKVNANGDIVGGDITTDSGEFDKSWGTVEADMAHEIGHALSPDDLAVAGDAQDKASVDETIAEVDAAEFGTTSSITIGAYQAYDAAQATATADTVASENAANVIGASIMGVQNFVTNYIGAETPGGDDNHGTLSDQLAAISAANPGVVIDVPKSVLNEEGVTTTQGQIVTVKDDVSTIPTVDADIGKALVTDDTDDHGTDTEKSVDQESTTDPNGDGSEGDGEADNGDGAGSPGGDGDGDGDGGDGDGGGGDGDGCDAVSANAKVASPDVRLPCD